MQKSFRDSYNLQYKVRYKIFLEFVLECYNFKVIKGLCKIIPLLESLMRL